MSYTSKGEPPDPLDSVLVLLATLFAAHRAGDLVLERLTERRLAELGACVEFPPRAPDEKGARNDR